MSPLALLSVEAVLSAFLVFCRVGGCFLVAPGLSSARVPAQARLFLAVALALALTPVLYPEVRPAVNLDSPAALLRAIGGELLVGILIGFFARLFLAALQTMAVAAAQAVGLGGMPAGALTDDDPAPAMAHLFTLTATALVFILDLHLELVRGLVASYGVVPVGARFSLEGTLADLADQFSETFIVALRVMSPFFMFALVANFAIGLVNKLTPQIPAFFIALPFMIAGAILLMGYTIREIMAGFMDAYGTYLVFG